MIAPEVDIEDPVLVIRVKKKKKINSKKKEKRINSKKKNCHKTNDYSPPGMR